MTARWILPTLAALLALPLAASADIIALKDGSIVEGLFKGSTVKNNRPVVQMELEDGKIRDIPQDDVAWMASAKPSWIIRKENQEWYDKEKAKLEAKGDKVKAGDHERIGRDSRRRSLDAQADEHFTKAYEMKVAEAKDTVAEHESIAK